MNELLEKQNNYNTWQIGSTRVYDFHDTRHVFWFGFVVVVVCLFVCLFCFVCLFLLLFFGGGVFWFVFGVFFVVFF